MELKFKPERLAIIKRLRQLSFQEIEARMAVAGGLKNRINIDRWEAGRVLPNTFEKVVLLAKATEVPVGYYFYNNVIIEMNKEMIVTIAIPETGETISFNFL